VIYWISWPGQTLLASRQRVNSQQSGPSRGAVRAPCQLCWALLGDPFNIRETGLELLRPGKARFCLSPSTRNAKARRLLTKEKEVSNDIGLLSELELVVVGLQ
jgi:hypothetical protein